VPCGEVSQADEPRAPRRSHRRTNRRRKISHRTRLAKSGSLERILAAWLGYQQGSPQFNTDFTIGGQEPQIVQSVLGLSGTVLICWEHDNIMPNMMQAINSAVPIANYDSIPNPWPNVFYLVWVLDLNTGTYTWTSVNQNLLDGDVQS
jgi:hypothetical protein